MSAPTDGMNDENKFCAQELSEEGRELSERERRGQELSEREEGAGIRRAFTGDLSG